MYNLISFYAYSQDDKYIHNSYKTLVPLDNFLVLIHPMQPVVLFLSLQIFLLLKEIYLIFFYTVGLMVNSFNLYVLKIIFTPPSTQKYFHWVQNPRLKDYFFIQCFKDIVPPSSFLCCFQQKICCPACLCFSEHDQSLFSGCF